MAEKKAELSSSKRLSFAARIAPVVFGLAIALVMYWATALSTWVLALVGAAATLSWWLIGLGLAAVYDDDDPRAW